MKLVVISHACVTPENQAFFQRISEVSGWQVTIVLPDQWKTDFKDQYPVQKHPGFQGRIVAVGVFLKGKIPLHFYHFEIFKAIAREQPDIIYIHNEPYTLSTFQIMLYNAIFLHKTIGFYAAQNLRKKYPLPFRLIEKFNFKMADYCFPVTESAGLALRERGYAGKISVLPLGVTADHLRRPAFEEPTVETNQSKPFLIGYVGRLVREKGIDVLLRALTFLKSPNWQCQIIGEGKIRDELEKMTIDLSIHSRTRFLGYVGHGEISRYMNAFSVLVLPSLTTPNWAEQFGRVIVEALAAGVPVIGTKSGEIPFLLTHLQGGIVVDEADAGALAGAIDRLAADPALARRLGQQGRRNVETYFSESKIAADFVTEVEDAIRARSAGVSVA